METDIIHCHNCYTMKVDEDCVCERCEQYYCDKCSARMTYHNQIDYNCCCNCSYQDPKHVDFKKDVDKNLIELEKEEIRRKYEKRKTKIDELMNQVDGKIYSDTIITSEKIYLKNDVTTNNENVDYLTEMFGIPTSFTMVKSCCLEINLNEKTWRYMFDHEVLYQNYNFIDLPTLKQIIRNKNIENLLKN